MRIIPASGQATEEASRLLRAGGVVAHATETCYGLACDLTNPAAVKKLFAIKGRAADKPVSAMFPSVEAAKPYVEWSDIAEEYARRHLPGPFTFVLRLSPSAPHALLPCPAGSDTVGIRVPGFVFARELALEAGIPLSTTSANRSGKENPYTADEVRAQFSDALPAPDLLIDGGPLPRVPPSSVIDLTAVEPRTLR